MGPREAERGCACVLVRISGFVVVMVYLGSKDA